MDKALDIFIQNLGYLAEDVLRIDTHYKDDSFLRDIVQNWHKEIEDSDYLTPIEAILFAEILFITNGYSIIPFVHDFNGEFPEGHDTVSSSQWTLGKYRADFAFHFQTEAAPISVVVECDGHDFHEKTKKQVAHDKKRDRFFLKSGVRVLRFSGSEIFNSHEDCIQEIADILVRVYDDFVLPRLLGDKWE